MDIGGLIKGAFALVSAVLQLATGTPDPQFEKPKEPTASAVHVTVLGRTIGETEPVIITPDVPLAHNEDW